MDMARRDSDPIREELHLQSNEEYNFYRLFQRVLDRILDSTRVSFEDVHDAIDEINESFNFENPPVDYSRPEVICGYLSRYATHSAGLARTTIVDAGRNCRRLKSVLEKCGELRVVSLGGGPGSDALGFCSALSELGHLGWTSLHITVVDAVEEWRECVTLVDQYLREDEFGSVSRLFRKKDVSMSFVRATLPGNPEVDAECYDALKNADLIIECKFLFRLDFLPRNQIIKVFRI